MHLQFFINISINQDNIIRKKGFSQMRYAELFTFNRQDIEINKKMYISILVGGKVTVGYYI